MRHDSVFVSAQIACVVVMPAIIIVFIQVALPWYASSLLTSQSAPRTSSGRQPRSSVAVMLVFDRQLGGQSLTLHCTWLPHAPAYCKPTWLSPQSAVSFQTPLAAAALQMSTTANRMEDGGPGWGRGGWGKGTFCKYCRAIQAPAAGLDPIQHHGPHQPCVLL